MYQYVLIKRQKSDDGDSIDGGNDEEFTYLTIVNHKNEGSVQILYSKLCLQGITLAGYVLFKLTLIAICDKQRQHCL